MSYMIILDRQPGYGIAGWLDNENGVIVYDRYDVWLIEKNGQASNLTKGDGRSRQVIYRIVDTDPQTETISTAKPALVTGYYDRDKNWGFYQLDMAEGGVTELLEDKKKYQFVAKAKNADRMLFTREDMHEFPDLWVSNLNLEITAKDHGHKPSDR